MMSYTDAENGKVALMQEILGVKDISSSTAVTEVRKPRPSSTAQQTTLKSSAKEKEN